MSQHPGKIKKLALFGASLFGASLFALGMGTEAYAQGGAIEEIIVTARARSESVQDVPGTVSVFGADTLRNAGVERAEDFISLTAGVSMVDAAEVGDTQVNIRGINGARDAENSFAFIIDGVLMSNTAAFNREFSDLQQIEVFKGPQGAIYGRNAAAGAVIVTTKKPSDEFEAGLKFSYGNERSKLVSGYLSGPIASDDLFVRVAADWRETDGFYKNTFLNDENVDDFSNFNLNGRLFWEPTEDFSFDLKARYGEVDAASISFNGTFHFPFSVPFIGPSIAEDVNDHEFIFQTNIDPSNEQESLEISGKLDYDAGWAELSAWMLYSDVDQNLLADGTSGAFGIFAAEPNCGASNAALFAQGFTLPPPQFIGPLPFFPNSFFGPYTPTTCDGFQYQVRNQRDVSFEARLTSPSDQRLRWQAGVYFLDVEREVGVSTGIDTGAPPPEALFVPGITEQLVHDRFDSNVYAIFGQLAYDVSDDIELAAALRYDREERKVTNLVPTDALTTFIDFDGDFFATGGAPLNPGLNPAINPSGVILPQKKNFEEIQPKVTATWDVTNDWTLFASWGVGFKSGGFNNQGSAATVDIFFNTPLGKNIGINDVFKKETSSAFEVGFKGGLLDDRVKLEGAFYRTNVDDMQFFEFLVGSFGLLRVVNNIDEVEITGGELAASAQVADGLMFFANGAITDSEIKKNSSRTSTVGNKSPYTPDYTVNLGGQWTVPVANGKYDIVTRVDYQLIGPTWFHTVQDELEVGLFSGLLGPAGFDQTQRDSYGTVNLRLALEGEHVSVAAFVKNATDKKYLEEVIPAPEFGGSFIHPAGRRFWGGEISFKY